MLELYVTTATEQATYRDIVEQDTMTGVIKIHIRIDNNINPSLEQHTYLHLVKPVKEQTYSLQTSTTGLPQELGTRNVRQWQYAIHLYNHSNTQEECNEYTVHEE